MKKSLSALFLLALGIALGFGYATWYASAPGAKPAAAKTGYHCPMHPNIRDDHASDCPICGMKLVPDKEQTTASSGVHVPGEKQQWIGLKSEPVQLHSATSSLRAPGRVTVDETRVVRVQTRYEGWIQSVQVDFTGKLVNKGDPMLTLYSPELVAGQQEYLLARRARDTLAHSSMEHVGAANLSMLEVARNRLVYHFGMTASAIDELDRTGQPQRIQTVYAPATGFVTVRNAFPNQRITPETELYTLADLAKVWVVADVNEADAAQVRLGASALIKPSLRGRVSYILPQIDPQTRTLKARIEVDNPGFNLKPDQYVDVEFGVAHLPRLAVPEDSVVDTGARSIVYIDLGDGHFEPREIVTGAFFDGKVEVLAGLKRGDRVVTSGAFLLDSESRLKAPSAPGGEPAEHKHD